jgi:RimJ/RimL family protein N-acetyltransferase
MTVAMHRRRLVAAAPATALDAGSRSAAASPQPARARPVVDGHEAHSASRSTRIGTDDSPTVRSMSELQFPVPQLTDNVVQLRPWREADVPGKLMAFNDPVVQRFSWSGSGEYTEADAYDYFAEQARARECGTALTVALADPEDGAVVLGGAALYDVDLAQGNAGIGYWLAREARGRGVATHAVRALTGWAFATLGLARIELTCAPDNDASQRVAERCGFAREGILRSHLVFKGGRRDSVLFSLLPGELR